MDDDQENEIQMPREDEPSLPADADEAQERWARLEERQAARRDDDDYDETGTRKRMAGDVMFVVGTEVQEHHFTEDGVHTVETTPWDEYWPSGTVVFTRENEVIGFKIGSVWLDVTGARITNFSRLINGASMLFMDDSDIDALREAYTDLTKVYGTFVIRVEAVRKALIDDNETDEVAE